MNDRGIPSRGKAIRNIYLAIAGLLLVIYAYLYIFGPLEPSINNVILTGMSPLAAFFSAVFATVVFEEYHPSDQPRKMWLGIMFGTWLWFAAEMIWAFNYITSGNSPAVTSADLGWIGGYPVFTIAIYYQFVLMMPSRRDFVWKLVVAVWALLLTLPAIIVFILGEINFGGYIGYFYPLADLALGVSGFLLVRLLRGSMLTRPWIGMIFFAFSDLFYAASIQSGIYDWSVSNNMLLSLFVDANYVFAYFLIALGFLENWMLIRFGLSPSS